MTELKTLKDLEKFWQYNYADVGGDLRNSAIEDIKELRKIDTSPRLVIGTDELSYAEKQAIINYIKKKFNLTKDDLK